MIDTNLIDKFWRFFTSNKEEFENINEDNIDEKLDLLLENLRFIETGLAVEISNEFNGSRELIISPEGDEKKFEIVQRIIDHAPKLEGWSFIAFRQPVNEDFTIEHNGLRFDTSEMFFTPLIENNNLDLIIYVKNIEGFEDKTVFYYGLITMDNVLGEYDCVMKVRYYDFVDLDKTMDKSQLKPLKDLRLFVKEFHDKRLN